MKHETHPVKFQTQMFLEDIKNTPRGDKKMTFVISPDPSWFVGEENYPFNFPAWYEEKVKEGIFHKGERVVCDYVTEHDYGFRPNSITVRYPRMKIDPDSPPVIDYYQGINTVGDLSTNYCRLSDIKTRRLMSEHTLAVTPQGKAWFKIAQSVYKELKLPEETIPCSPIVYYQQLKQAITSTIYSDVIKNYIRLVDELIDNNDRLDRFNLIVDDLQKQISKTRHCSQTEIESEVSVGFYLLVHKLSGKLFTIIPENSEEESTPEKAAGIYKTFTEISELLENVLEVSFGIFGVHSNTCGNKIGQRMIEELVKNDPYPG